MLCLKVPTDPGWARAAMASIEAILVDHAHCELKAASNAMSLIARHPDDPLIVKALIELAKDELEHFERAVLFLTARGLSLGTPEVDTYAAELRKAAGRLPRGQEGSPLVDRLLVAAVIEARSCERFKLLLDHWSLDDQALRAFYEELFACEAKHYRVLYDLALRASGGRTAAVEARLLALAFCEGRLVTDLASHGSRATVHG
jgi:tRNA-(ms[2]io[6]A)-hydroxylase